MPKDDRFSELERLLERAKSAADGLDSVGAARDLVTATQRWERSQIKAARSNGVSWSKIGGLYGLSKQGAQQRFAKPPDDHRDRPAPSSSESQDS